MMEVDQEILEKSASLLSIDSGIHYFTEQPMDHEVCLLCCMYEIHEYVIRKSVYLCKRMSIGFE